MADFIESEEQKIFMQREIKDHNVLVGPAGSGKTNLAIAKFLNVAEKIGNKNKVAFISYAKSVKSYANAMFDNVFTGMFKEVIPEAVTYYSFIGKYCAKYKMGEFLDDGQRRALIKKALDIVEASIKQEKEYTKKLAIYIDEIGYIQEYGFNSEKEYVESERIGRKDVRIRRENKADYWKVYEKYRELRREKNIIVIGTMRLLFCCKE